jgi:DNA polymerase-1
VLEALQGEYPIVEHILNYRQMEKLRSTYIEALPQYVNPNTKRVHCTFNQSIAATGRLASQDPNLQNIPVRTEIGRRIRRAFRPQKEGYSYISADYSQIELRLLAHLSEDPTLLKAFHHNMDIHQHTASQIFDIPLEQVTKAQRNSAEAVNFGIVYGQGPYGLSQQLGVTQKEAKEFIERYFARYGKVKGFIEGQIAKAKETGKAVTMTGRERAIPEIHNKNPNLRQGAERLAINTPLQGTAADLIKIAMLRVEKTVPGKMILQIHDELLFEVEDSEIEGVIPKIREAMEGVWTLKVPLIVDVEVGKNWEEC